jgi:hypothetical protein
MSRNRDANVRTLADRGSALWIQFTCEAHTDQSSINTNKGAPRPRREPGAYPTRGKGPDHNPPSWEIVAEMLYSISES